LDRRRRGNSRGILPSFHRPAPVKGSDGVEEGHCDASPRDGGPSRIP
jgi:hypothetical protein